jgi:uncharacterized membrane protein
MALLRSLIKSIIYRIITIFLGFLVTYLVTGNVSAALSIGLATEAVQFVYYFGFESVWSYYDEKRLRAQISAEFRDQIIDVKLTLGALVDMAKEFSQVDTFIPEVYNSIRSFFNKMLENKQLSELHEEFEKYRRSFETTHRDRGFNQ